MHIVLNFSVLKTEWILTWVRNDYFLMQKIEFNVCIWTKHYVFEQNTFVYFSIGCMWFYTSKPWIFYSKVFIQAGVSLENAVAAVFLEIRGEFSIFCQWLCQRKTNGQILMKLNLNAIRHVIYWYVQLQFDLWNTNMFW